MRPITNLKTALSDIKSTRLLKLKISGPIPKEIEQLIYLEELYLEGDFTDFNLNLVFLNNLKLLSINSSMLVSFPLFALTAPHLTNLKILAGKFTTIQIPIGAIFSLKSMTIKNTNVSELPFELNQFLSIEELNLSNNHLKTLPENFNELKKLLRLNLDQNEFNHFPDIIKKCSQLKKLSIDGNKFSENEKERIQREYFITPN